MESIIDSKGVSCIRVQPKDCKACLGITHKTFYKHAEDKGWERIDGQKGAVYYLVPVIHYREYQSAPLPVPEPIVARLPIVSELVPESKITDSSESLRGYEIAVQSLREQLSGKDALLKAKEEQIGMLNNELAAHKTQIQRYKSQEDKLEEMRQSIEALRQSAPPNPWWKFWAR